MITKYCEICKSQFNPKIKTAKYCSNACRSKSYRLRNPNRTKEIRKRHYDKNREKILAKDRAKHKANPEKSRLMCRRWYNKNKEYRREYTKKYREANRDLFKWLKDKERFGGLRAYTIERDNGCVICKTKNKLCVHHIDGKGYNDKKPNNNPLNLVTLCKSCHIKLHTYQTSNSIKFNSIEDIVRTRMKILESRRNTRSPLMG